MMIMISKERSIASYIDLDLDIECTTVLLRSMLANYNASVRSARGSGVQSLRYCFNTNNKADTKWKRKEGTQ